MKYQLLEPNLALFENILKTFSQIKELLAER